MIVGVPTEIETHEHGVGLTPAAVREYIARGHRVLVETGAGDGMGTTAAEYENAGTEIAAGPAQVFKSADLIVKVKEPQRVEWEQLLRGADTLHLSASRARSRAGSRTAGFRLHHLMHPAPGRAIPAPGPDRRRGRSPRHRAHVGDRRAHRFGHRNEAWKFANELTQREMDRFH